MGRIRHEGQELVDVEGAMAILKKSRRTVNRLITEGSLPKIKVPGDKKAYFPYEVVMTLSRTFDNSPSAELRRMKVAQETSNPKEPPHLQQLRKWHPELFNQCR